MFWNNVTCMVMVTCMVTSFTFTDEFSIFSIKVSLCKQDFAIRLRMVLYCHLSGCTRTSLETFSCNFACPYIIKTALMKFKILLKEMYISYYIYYINY